MGNKPKKKGKNRNNSNSSRQPTGSKTATELETNLAEADRGSVVDFSENGPTISSFDRSTLRLSHYPVIAKPSQRLTLENNQDEKPNEAENDLVADTNLTSESGSTSAAASASLPPQSADSFESVLVTEQENDTSAEPGESTQATESNADHVIQDDETESPEEGSPTDNAATKVDSDTSARESNGDAAQIEEDKCRPAAATLDDPTLEDNEDVTYSLNNTPAGHGYPGSDDDGFPECDPSAEFESVAAEKESASREVTEEDQLVARETVRLDEDPSPDAAKGEIEAQPGTTEHREDGEIEATTGDQEPSPEGTISTNNEIASLVQPAPVKPMDEPDSGDAVVPAGEEENVREASEPAGKIEEAPEAAESEPTGNIDATAEHVQEADTTDVEENLDKVSVHQLQPEETDAGKTDMATNELVGSPDNDEEISKEDENTGWPSGMEDLDEIENSTGAAELAEAGDSEETSSPALLSGEGESGAEGIPFAELPDEGSPIEPPDTSNIDGSRAETESDAGDNPAAEDLASEKETEDTPAPKELDSEKTTSEAQGIAEDHEDHEDPMREQIPEDETENSSPATDHASNERTEALPINDEPVDEPTSLHNTNGDGSAEGTSTVGTTAVQENEKEAQTAGVSTKEGEGATKNEPVMLRDQPSAAVVTEPEESAEGPAEGPAEESDGAKGPTAEEPASRSQSAEVRDPVDGETVEEINFKDVPAGGFPSTEALVEGHIGSGGAVDSDGVEIAQEGDMAASGEPIYTSERSSRRSRKKSTDKERELHHPRNLSSGHRTHPQRQKGGAPVSRWAKALNESKRRHEGKARSEELKKQTAAAVAATASVKKRRRSTEQLKHDQLAKSKEPENTRQKDRSRYSESKTRTRSSSPKPRAFLKYMTTGESDNRPLLRINAGKASSLVADRSRRSSTTHSHHKTSIDQSRSSYRQHDETSQRETRRARKLDEESKQKKTTNERETERPRHQHRDEAERPRHRDRSKNGKQHHLHRHSRGDRPREESKAKVLWKAIISH